MSQIETCSFPNQTVVTSYFQKQIENFLSWFDLKILIEFKLYSTGTEQSQAS